MSAKDTIASMPFNPTSEKGTGFLPPLLRGIHHLMFLMACIADEEVTVNDADAVAELLEAHGHLEAITIAPSISTDTAARTAVLRQAVIEFRDEYTGLTAVERTDILRDLVHRSFQFAADLDRELTGTRQSDPGTSL